MNNELTLLDMMVDGPEKESYRSQIKTKKKEETEEELDDRVYGHEYSKWILRYRVEIDRRRDIIIFCWRKLEEYKKALDNALKINDSELCESELDCIDQMYKTRIEEVIHDSVFDCETRIFDGFSRLSILSKMRDFSQALWQQDEILRELNMIYFDLKIKHDARYNYCMKYV
ncbi:MAG: hypothetical protein RBT80_23875 [Candidatus Vecturithrix sp.]|jgi:hypothetical protein|nr:hypothetical protein [Candidatus Vecturithrix sp.]